MRRLSITAFRCFAHVELDLDQPLIVFVGDNDVGKTTLLDAISIAYFHGELREPDVRRRHDETVQECRIEAEFQLTRDPTETLRIRRTLRDGHSEDYVYVQSLGPDYDDFSKKNADTQKALIQRLGEAPGKNKEERLRQVAWLEKNHPEASLQWKRMREPGPPLSDVYTERMSARDFTDPNALIGRAIERNIRSLVKDYEAQNPHVFAPLRNAIDTIVANSEIELEKELRTVLPTLKAFRIHPAVDFSSPGVSTDIELDVGAGPNSIKQFGDGTSRRTWIAVQNASAMWDADARVVRLYDEPDAQLHFRAQRELFSQIQRWSLHESTAQTFICTHAVTLIDRCAPQAIRLVQHDPVKGSLVLPLASTDSEFQMFEQLGRFAGLRNLALLYEKAFLLVEGPTEVAAITEIYARRFARTLEADGIRIVNLETCGAWRSVVTALGHTRSGMIHILLDADCRDSLSAKLTPEVLQSARLSESDVTLIGTKEFEDAFEDEDWLAVLNDHYPRQDETRWERHHLEEPRRTKKFSDAIVRLIRRDSVPNVRSNANKPELGYLMGLTVDLERLPPSLSSALSRVVEISGVEIGVVPKSVEI
ncbi:MAG: AAA family ATPase [Myxococcota bacterium]